MRPLFVLAILALPACEAAKESDPCPSGICVGNPGDGGAGADLTGAPCVESWTCTAWTSNGSGQYSRSCADQNRCGTTASEPPTGPTALPALDLDYFKCKVEPVLDRGCAMMGCHGTAVDDNTRAFRVFARGRRRNRQTVPPLCLDTQPVNLETGSGTVMCYGWTAHTAEEWQANFDSARALLLGVQNPDDSDLLAQPVVGGKAHTGVHLFASAADPDYQTLRAWLAGAKLGATCNPMN
jgi:hypothetical protein